MNEHVRLSTIVVKDLFGYYSYDIRLNNDMSFLFGPNGCGKTTILNLIAFLLDPSSRIKLDKIYNIPFEEAFLTFENGNTIGIKKRKGEGSKFRYFYQKGSGKRRYFEHSAFSTDAIWRNAIPFECSRGSLLIPDSSTVREFTWIDTNMYLNQESREFVETTINSFFKPTGKTARFDGDGQIEVRQGKTNVPKERLSFGEQYILNTMIRLASSLSSDRLVMIDLPESSLHIAIQEEFADIVYELCEKRNLQVVMVTHSPSIVNGHLEWYADRKWTDKRQKEVVTAG